MEEFRDIPGYEGHYQVSNLGNVKSLKNGRWGLGKEKILKPSEHFGYLHNVLCKLGNKKFWKVHRLVMFTFVGENNSIINHKNGIKHDNRLINLEYCTQSENMLHKFRVLGYKSHRNKKVNQFSLTGEFIKTWDCMSDITRELGIYTSGICYTCQGKYKNSGGYIWKYKT